MGFLVAVIAAAAVVFVVLQSGSGGDGDDTAKGVQVVTVNDGKPVGGVKTLTYEKGDQVELEVRLNRPAEEIHVHGYEIEQPAERSPVRISFPAKIDGVFEIEVHEQGGEEAEIAELHVNP